MDHVDLIKEQEITAHKCRKLFNIVTGTPLNTNKKATPSQAVYLTSIYGVENALKLVEGSRDLAASLICSKYKDTINYVIEGMSLNMIYLVATLGIVSSSELEFVDYIEQITAETETDEDSYEVTKELLSDMEIHYESEDIPQETRIYEDENKTVVSFYDKECMDWNGLNTIKEADLISTNQHDSINFSRQFGTEIQQKLIKVVNGTYDISLLVDKKLFNPKDCTKPHWDTKTIAFDEDFDLIRIHNVGVKDDAIFVPKGAYIAYHSLEDNSKLLILSDNETDELYTEEIKDLSSLVIA